VVIANVTVNSQIGLSGTLALMLLGQTIFGLLVDSLGLFQMKKRALSLYDFFEVLTIMTGSAVLIFFATHHTPPPNPGEEALSMYWYVLLAFSNGLIIALARVVNARLSESKGPMRASLWNHFVGFVLLLVVVAITSDFSFLRTIGDVPAAAYLGGIIGACFVALNSFVMPRIGAMRTILLVISGQMISASLLDSMTNVIASFPAQLLGVSLILVGITISRRASHSIKATSE
jgi:transporter family-2 protein